MILESLPAYFTDKLIRRIESIKKNKKKNMFKFFKKYTLEKIYKKYKKNMCH